jgi:hypothetical protein
MILISWSPDFIVPGISRQGKANHKWLGDSGAAVATACAIGIVDVCERRASLRESPQRTGLPSSRYEAARSFTVFWKLGSVLDGNCS